MEQLERLLQIGCLLLVCYKSLAVCSEEVSYCTSAINGFVSDQAHTLTSLPNASQMLFFLHIPRTAGRTLHSCFLKAAIPPSRRCQKSYDVLRLNASIPSCGLLGSHDDFSISDNLPTGTAYITQLRDPVDRVLSAYEFATEVAARSTLEAAGTSKSDGRTISTRNVWPWSSLVPWLEEELHDRWPRAKQHSVHQKPSAYNHPMIVPLAEWIEHPLVKEMVHDGQTLQVLGLTNYSQWEHAKQLRACLQDAPGSAKTRPLELAIRRLHTFAHVSVMEQLDEAVASVAALLNLTMQGPAWMLTTPGAFADDEATEAAVNSLATVTDLLSRARRDLVKVKGLASAAAAALKDGRPPAQQLEQLQARVAELQVAMRDLQGQQAQLQQRLASKESIPKQVKEDSSFRQKEVLWRSFRTCEARAQAKTAARRAKSLVRFPGLRFGREARKAIDPAIITRIRELNSMDVALHQEGQRLMAVRLAQQRESSQLERVPRLSEYELQRVQGPYKQGAPKSGQQQHSAPSQWSVPSLINSTVNWWSGVARP